MNKYWVMADSGGNAKSRRIGPWGWWAIAALTTCIALQLALEPMKGNAQLLGITVPIYYSALAYLVVYLVRVVIRFSRRMIENREQQRGQRA